MIGKTERDPVIQGNNETGRLNLKGQQKPDYLVDAIEAEEKAWQEYYEVAYAWELGKPQDEMKKTLGIVDAAIKAKDDAYARYNQECTNENH
jgi:hypothetical protein